MRNHFRHFTDEDYEIFSGVESPNPLKGESPDGTLVVLDGQRLTLVLPLSFEDFTVDCGTEESAERLGQILLNSLLNTRGED